MLHLEGYSTDLARTGDILPAWRKIVAASAETSVWGHWVCGISDVPVPEQYQSFHCPAERLEQVCKCELLVPLPGSDLAAIFSHICK